MQAISTAALAATSGDTRRALKRTARKLFAERGIREVTVREIALAAGQRNMGAVAYHFGTKDALITELLVDGAERIEARRHAFLDLLEAEGGPKSAREAVAAIVLPTVQFADEDEVFGSSFNQYLLRLTMYDASFVDRALEGRYNAGYQRCLAHLRRLLPGLPAQVQNHRFVFLGAYLSTLLARREAMLADKTAAHRHWRAASMIDDLIATAAALLQPET